MSRPSYTAFSGVIITAAPPAVYIARRSKLGYPTTSSTRPTTLRDHRRNRRPLDKWYAFIRPKRTNAEAKQEEIKREANGNASTTKTSNENGLSNSGGQMGDGQKIRGRRVDESPGWVLSLSLKPEGSSTYTIHMLWARGRVSYAGEHPRRLNDRARRVDVMRVPRAMYHPIIPSPHYSIIPLFHHSIITSLYHTIFHPDAYSICRPPSVPLLMSGCNIPASGSRGHRPCAICGYCGLLWYTRSTSSRGSNFQGRSGECVGPHSLDSPLTESSVLH